MHNARAPLERGDHSVECVAREVGYESLTAFNRVFREHFGITPIRFRMPTAVPGDIDDGDGS
jgi:AraC-like DNA-binding protein